MANARQPLSLKARAIALLALREHSRTELRRKLLRIAAQLRQRAAEAADLAGAAADRPPARDATGPEDLDAQVDALLLWLQTQGYLNETRFAESRVHARAARYGNRRIEQELARHGLRLDAEAQSQLRQSELERARAVWQKKFAGASPVDAAGRVRQMRFLAARGFSAEVIRRLLRFDEDA